MGIFNFTKPEEKSKSTEPEVKEATTPEPVSPEPTVTATTSETPTEEKTIVLDGPLSTIYTQALNVLYGNTDSNKTVSTESQANDSIILSSIQYLQNEDQKKQEEATITPSDTYLYVTDTKALKEIGTADAFNALNIALGMERFKKVGLCVECNKYDTPSGITSLLEYCDSKKVRLFFNQGSALNFIKE